VPLYVLCYVQNGILLPFANMEKMELATFRPWIWELDHLETGPDPSGSGLMRGLSPQNGLFWALRTPKWPISDPSGKVQNRVYSVRNA